MPGVPQTLPVPPLVNEMTMLNAIRLAAEGGGGGASNALLLAGATASTLGSLTAATADTGGLLYGTQGGADRKFTLTAAGATLVEAANATAQRTALGLGTIATLSSSNPTLFGVTVANGSLTINGNISAAAWTTTGVRIKGTPGTLTDISGAGTVAAAYTNAFSGNTIAASNARTFTNYVTSYHTSPTAGTNVTFTQKWGLGTDLMLVNGNGAASQPALALTGTPFTGGTATTTKPLFSIEPTGTTSTGWATEGTMFGVNAASGFAGNLIDLQTNGVRMFNVTGAGVATIGSLAATAINISSGVITAVFGGSTTNRASITMTAGSGSSVRITTAGISANDGLIVSRQGNDADSNLLGGFATFTSRTFNVRPCPKDFDGAYTGAGHIMSLAGGTAASAGVGGAGGALNITGGAAAGSGNNNGGDVVITGGAKTGSGTVGIVQIASGTSFRLGNAATTGLGAGVLAATTNATIVIQDSTGQAYRIPCII